MNHRPTESDHVRIHSANGDPYRILDLSRDATTEDVKAAYKALALKFHPDRIKLPPNSSKDRNYDKLAADYRDKCASLFKLAAEACATLGDPSRRAEYDRTHRMVESGALVPYRAQTEPAPHLRSTSNDRYDQRAYQPRAYTEPYRPSPPNPYRQSDPYQSPFDELDLFQSNDYRGKLAPPPYNGHRPASARPVFDDRPRYDEPKSSIQPMGGASDPFAFFQNLFPSGGALGEDFFDLGLPNHQSLGDGDSLDPLSKLMNGLELGAGGPVRGAWSQQRLTHRHTNRNGQVTMTRQQKTMMAMDAGERGQVVLESSFKVVGRGSAMPDFPKGGGGGQFPMMNKGHQANFPMMESFDSPSSRGRDANVFNPQDSPRPMIDQGRRRRSSLMSTPQSHDSLVPYGRGHEVLRRQPDPFALPGGPGSVGDFNRGLPAIAW